VFPDFKQHFQTNQHVFASTVVSRTDKHTNFHVHTMYLDNYQSFFTK